MQILGIDVGGTGIKGAIVDTITGELLTTRHRIETPKPATPQAVIGTIVALTEEFGWKETIGCGFPAAVRHDVVMTASNIDKSWIGLNAGQEIMKASGCKTHLVNDADAAGYAEMNFGAGYDNTGTVIVVAVGTGIGTSVFTEGILYPNSELGFIRVKGMAGEHYASNAVRAKEELSWKEWGKRINRYLSRLEELLWPDLFILGGGVSKKFDNFKQYLELEAPIVPAKMLNNAGIVGAALAAKHEFFTDHHHSV